MPMSESRIKKCSVPSKLILFGEYSVLEGGICLSVAINKRSTLYEGKNEIVTTGGEIVDIKQDSGYIELGVPIGSGLGSSAVLSILLNCYKKNVLESAHEMENNFHGNASGVDVSTCFFGGFLLFKSEKLIRNSNEKEPIKDINESKYQLKDKIVDQFKDENDKYQKMEDYDENNYIFGEIFTKKIIFGDNVHLIKKINPKYIQKYQILIFDSKIKKDTQHAIKKLNSNSNENNNFQNKKKSEIIQEIIKNTENALQVLNREFLLNEIYPLIRNNQDLLEELGICPVEMKEEIIKLRSMGYESKITGAGFGGHLYTIVPRGVNIENWVPVEIEEDGVIFFNK